MNNLSYQVRLSNEQLAADVRRARANFMGLSSSVQAEGRNMDSAIQTVGKSLAVYFSVRQLGGFIKDIALVRGEFQQLEVAFTTMLKSKSKADKLMQEVVQFAATTPYELADVGKGAKQLLAFQVPAEEITSTLRKIGDLAAGSGAPLNDLVSIYGKVKAKGKVQAEEMNQFLEKGIPLVSELAKQYGVTEAAIYDMASKSQISFNDVDAVITKLTGSGGMFFNLMEEQSKTITGQISNLSDAFTQMLNEIGESNEGLFNDGLSGAKYLVENYQEIGQYVGELIGIYGLYRAALITTAAVQKSTVAVQRTSEAQELFKLLDGETQAAISKQNLSVASAEYAAIVKVETANKLEGMQVTLAKAEVELIASKAALSESVKSAKAAASLVEKRQDEYLLAVSSGKAKKIEAANTALLSAQEERNIAIKHSKNLKADVGLLNSRKSAAATGIETLSVSANTAANSANVTSTKILAVAKAKLLAVMKKVQATMLANPYIAIAAAVAVLGYAIYKLATAETSTEKAHRKYNESLEKQAELKENLLSKTDKLISTIEDETQTVYSQIKAWKELKNEMPDALGDMSMREFKDMDSSEQKALINKAVDENEIKQLDKDVEAAKQHVEGLRVLLDQVYSTVSTSGSVASTANYYRKQVEEAEELLRLKQEEKEKRDEIIRQAEYEAKPDEEKLEILNQQLEAYKKQYEEIENLIPESERIGQSMTDGITPAIGEINESWGLFDLQTSLNIAQLEGLNGEMNDIKKSIAAINGANAKGLTYGEAKENARIAYEETKKALDDIIKNSDDYSEKAYKEAVKKASEAKKAYQDLGGKVDKKTTSPKDYTSQIEQDLIKEQRLLIDQQFETDNLRIEAMDEGLDKILAKNNLNHLKELEQIRRQKEERLTELQNQEKTVFLQNGGEEENFTPKTTDLPEVDKSYFQELENASYVSYEKRGDAAVQSEQDKVDELLKEFATYEEKRLQITKEYSDKIEKLRSSQKNGENEDNIAEAEKKRNSELAELDSKAQGSTSAISRLFADMSDKSIEEMRKLATEGSDLLSFLSEGVFEPDNDFGLTKAQFETIIGDPALLEALEKKVIDLKKSVLGTNSAFETMGEGLIDIAEGRLEQGLGKIQGAISNVTSFAGMFADSLSSIAELSGNDSFAQIAEGINIVSDAANSAISGAVSGAAVAGPVGAAIGAAMGIVSSLTAKLAENKAERESLKAEIKQNALDEYLAQYDINQLYRERYEWAQKIGETTLDYIARNGEELEKQIAANKREQDNLTQNLSSQEYVNGEHFESTGFMGLGKGKTIQEFDSLAGKSWEEIERIAASGDLSEQGQSFYDALKAAREEGDDLADRQEEYIEELKEIYTGTTRDSIADGIIDGFEQGFRSAEEFADSFEGLMKDAVMASLKLQSEEAMFDWYDQFAAYSENGLTPDEIALLQGQYNSIIEQMAIDADLMEQATGIDLSSNTSRSAITGGFETMGQDTANELNGRFTAIQGHTFRISETIEIMRANSDVALGHLANISANTYKLNNMALEMTSMKRDLSEMNTFGIKMR